MTVSLPTVLITGCSPGGIGSALAETFHARNHHVIATARSISKLSHLSHHPNMTLLQLDVTSPADISAAVEAVTSLTGRMLNYLINNSGVPLTLPALDTPLQKAKDLFDVNFWGVVAMTQSFSPLLIKAKGTIVNICSLGGVMAVPWNAFYASSKAAIKSYSESLRQELAPFGVKVVTVMSGVVSSNLWTRAPELDMSGSMYEGAKKEITDMATGQVVKDAMPPSEYARRVVDDLLGGATGVIWRGKMATITWFMTSFVPGWIMDRMLVAGSGLEKLG
ncbi:NAD(P)-binding protein [Aspergillus sclerotioniger CBS 115572]|uniref:NAD(P)-binding protein n=1 Tax=Aspergillus sclerotioniger CBS 115572 TaxID=1450535 RepID=A0A317W937_9EURO|nr:NAD(P)-binding protein [Aspergillus sclerotioniger CBS 115572]PWY81762.1 NAD(P)-binding protein [Aspergillus sclerotioniger CBS 115572]